MLAQRIEAPSQTPARAVHLGPDQGEATWFLDHLVVVKLAERDAAPYGVAEIRLGPGGHTPYHRHHDEEESFYVLSGAMKLFIEGRPEAVEATAGSFVHIPRGVAHGFSVDSEVKFLVLSAPDGFVEFTREFGTRAPALKLPPEAAPDLDRLQRLAQKYRIEILGPLPE